MFAYYLSVGGVVGVCARRADVMYVYHDVAHNVRDEDADDNDDVVLRLPQYCHYPHEASIRGTVHTTTPDTHTNTVHRLD